MAPSQYRPTQLNGHGVFTSPTESEFSESYKDASSSVLHWDEERVGEWLKSINCAQYVDTFRKNNITGENLMDLDQATLKEMGIKKIGDRVRINAHAKVFRSNVYKRTSKQKSKNASRSTASISKRRAIQKRTQISTAPWTVSQRTYGHWADSVIPLCV